MVEWLHKKVDRLGMLIIIKFPKFAKYIIEKGGRSVSDIEFKEFYDETRKGYYREGKDG